MSKKLIFGVDVGGTAIKFGIFDSKGTLHKDWEIPTDKSDCGAHIMEQVAVNVETILQVLEATQDDVVGIGIGVPGPVLENGEVVEAANLGWYHRNIVEELELMSSLNVKAGNDANVAALGEMWAGSGKDFRNIVLLTLGTGVGGGIIQNGQLVYGNRGGGGEIGHMCVDTAEVVPCNCGKYGCLEQYASASGVVRLAKPYYPEAESAKDVWDAVRAGDERACQVAEVFGEKLGLALANLAVTLNPELFLLGGGMSKAGDVMLPYIKKYYEKYVFAPCKDVTFGFASLGNQAGIYGAAKLVLGEE